MKDVTTAMNEVIQVSKQGMHNNGEMTYSTLEIILDGVPPNLAEEAVQELTKGKKRSKVQSIRLLRDSTHKSIWWCNEVLSQLESMNSRCLIELFQKVKEQNPEYYL